MADLTGKYKLRTRFFDGQKVYVPGDEVLLSHVDAERGIAQGTVHPNPESAAPPAAAKDPTPAAPPVAPADSPASVAPPASEPSPNPKAEKKQNR